MSSISFSNTSISFPALQPGTLSNQELVAISVEGNDPVQVSLAISGPNSNVFSASLALMEVLAERTTVPLLFVPFATSIVLVMGSPEAEPAQPRALVGGHLVSAAVGLLLLQVTGPGPWAMSAAACRSRATGCALEFQGLLASAQCRQ